MSVTRYFRQALAAQMSPRVDFKNGVFAEVSQDQIEKGWITKDDAKKLFDDARRDIKEDEAPTLPVLIAVKTIQPEIIGTVKTSTSVDDLTCVFFLPAILTINGELRPSPDKEPWFVREFLSPMVEPELSIGSDGDVDSFLQNNVAEKKQIDSWEKNWAYARKMYEFVTNSYINSEIIGNLEKIKANHNCYVFVDKMVNASYHIMNLYDTLIVAEKTECLPLYKKFTSTNSATPRPLCENGLVFMKEHCGQMGGNYPLSPSQRESLNHLFKLDEGEILAVSGPPGTGKTTLLQSVVANLMTERAIARMSPPVIVASSTNNQAVTNIIDSFGHVNQQGIRNLETRWVTAANSFAVYFPSAEKMKVARNKEYQVSDDMIAATNSQETIEESKKYMLTACGEYFADTFTSVAQCKQKIHNELTDLEKLRRQLLDNFDILLRQTQGKTVVDYTCWIKIAQSGLKKEIKDIEEKIDAKRRCCNMLRSRLEEWRAAYKKLPWYVRFFSFISTCEKRIIQWTKTYKSDSELIEFETAVKPQMVWQRYDQKINAVDNEIYDFRCRAAKLQRQIGEYDSKNKIVQNMFDSCLRVAAELFNHSADLIFQQGKKANEKDKPESSTREVLSKCDLDAVNNLIDTSVRYVEFWLAVHYYECAWLTGSPLTEKQLPTNHYDVVKCKLTKLAALTPCMVMTFYMLPKQFKVWKANENVSSYLYNEIDLLIVDEAGQTSPEIASPAFSLAKRAIVVGDEQQISPVWGIRKPLDIALALESGVIKAEKEFEALDERGLITSKSSVMKVAAMVCPYRKYDHGLFLCEHRRCYDEIISYCNELVYKNKLQPCRGKAGVDDKRPKGMMRYPVFGYHDIRTDRSERIGSSRINRKEATEIAMWLQLHYEAICEEYASMDNPVLKQDVLAVITPFKKQVKVIKEELKKALGERSENIAVGTVHTFQGGERRIIIFSTTYGAEDGCSFIDREHSLMNVAVSRAKDAFWVFGCRDCLRDKSEKIPSGLLDRYVERHQII